MHIRPTRPDDFPQLLTIYERARAFMAATGNPLQWGPTHWPPEELLLEDIAVGRSFVCVNDEDTVLGTFCYIHGKDIDQTYAVIQEGSWSSDAAYGVVHRLAAAEGTKGVGALCLNWAVERSGYLRVDTHPDNRVMQNLLTKLGFTKTGIIHVVEDDYPRYAYDKVK